MRKKELYYFGGMLGKTGKDMFKHFSIPDYENQYTILLEKPLMRNGECVKTGRLICSDKKSLETEWLESCIALYFIFDEWICLYHIFTVRDDGYAAVKNICKFVNETNKKNMKVIYGIVEGVFPLDDDDERKLAVFQGVEEIPEFLAKCELERKQDLMSHSIIITKDNKIVVRNQESRLYELWNIDFLPSYPIGQTLNRTN